MPRRINLVALGSGAAFEAHRRGAEGARFVRLHGVACRGEEPRNLPAKVRRYRRIDDVLADPEVDAVSVLLPSAMHARAAIRGLRHGKHVLVEKPVATGMREATALLRAARESGLVGAYVSQFRFAPGVEALREALRAGYLGRLVHAHCELSVRRDDRYFDERPWRSDLKLAGGGVVMMNGIHVLDVLGWVLGEARVLAAEVTASRPGVRVEDGATILLRYPQGVLCTFSMTTRAAQDHPTRMRFTGTAGDLELVDYRVRGFCSERVSVAPTSVGHSPAQSFRAQLEDFGVAILRGAPPRTPIADGVKTLSVVLEAYRKSRRSRAQ